MHSMTTNTASPAQVKFAMDLWRDLYIITGNADILADYDQTIEQGFAAMDKATISAEIDTLKDAIRKERHAQRQSASEAMEEGIYMKNATVYKVQRSKTSGNLYTKTLHTDPARWEYTPEVMRDLSLSDKITMEQAQEFGMKFGICAICGRLLTDPDSIDRGIGPVCANRI